MIHHMLSRTTTIFTLLLLLVAAPVAAQQAVTQTDATQAEMTPAEALQMLKDGNERFIAEQMFDREFDDQVEQTATGQYPFAVVLGCIDSRVPPEIVFDQGIGDIFSARVAGNFVNSDILGSMEFATAVAGSKVIVVLGHTSCGAVKGACDNVELGNLTHTLSNIAPAIYSVTDVEGERNSSNAEYVSKVAHANVELTVQNILDRSPVIRDQVENGEVMVVGAMYDVTSGQVMFMDKDASMDDM
jgi:carbonic anhydrase